MGFMKKVMAAAQGPPAAMNNRIHNQQHQSQHYQQQSSSYPTSATTTSMPTAYAAQVAPPYIPPGGGGGEASTSHVLVASEYAPHVSPAAAMAIPASAVHLTSHLPITAATPPTVGGGTTTNNNSLYSTFNNMNLDAINSAPPYIPPGSTATTAASSTSTAATTMRVPIPEGMNPGQQIRVRGPDGSEVVKSIPPQNEWKYDAPKPYFRVQFGGTFTTTTTTPQVLPQKTKTPTTTTTMRIPVPDGYGPDQQIRVRGPDGSEVVKPIPPRNEWQYDNGKPFFRLQFYNNDAASGATSYNPYANHNNGVPTTYDQLISTTSAPTYDPWEQNTATSNNNNNGLSPAAEYNPYINPANGVTPLQQNNNNSSIPPMATAVRVDHHSSGGGGVMGGAPLSDYCIEWRRFYPKPVQFSPPPLGLKSVPSIPRGVSSAVSPNGRHKSLLIGINYEGTRAKLRGCVNDAKNMMTLLQRNGFPNDGSHMLLLSDERNRGREYQPTVENILKAIKWFMNDVRTGDVLFFHFSGHGGQVPDKSGHESDGWNETIVPVDFQKKGQITDDVLWGTLCYDLPEGARLTALMDMCHSGTGLDLPYDYNVRTKQWKEDTNPAHSAGDVCLFSGCEDAQTSADIGGGYGKEAGGAMTQAFLKAYESTAVMSTYHEFLEMVQRQLKSKGLSQRPQLTSSQMFDARSRIFSLGCNSPPGGGDTNCMPSFIEPNHNPTIGREKRRHVKPGRQGFMGGGGGGGNNAMQMVGGLMAGAFIADMLF